MNTMADGAAQRLDAQIADALFGQPGMSKLDVANRLRQLRGDGGALLGSAAYPAAWMWPHPEDGSVRFTADGDVATEAASMGRAVSALYRVPVQEDARPSPAGQGGISAEWVIGYLTTDAPEESREAIRNAFAEYAALSAARQPVGEPVTVEAVATVRRWATGDCYIDWLTEGGIADLEVGDVLMVSDRAITDEDGSGEVYAAQPAQTVGLGQLPDGWRLSKKATCYQLSHGSDIVGNLIGPDAEENAAIIARVLDSKAVGNG